MNVSLMENMSEVGEMCQKDNTRNEMETILVKEEKDNDKEDGCTSPKEQNFKRLVTDSASRTTPAAASANANPVPVALPGTSYTGHTGKFSINSLLNLENGGPSSSYTLSHGDLQREPGEISRHVVEGEKEIFEGNVLVNYLK